MSPISASGPVRCQRTGDAPTFRYHLKASSPSGAACVSLRSHSNGGHQPHARRLPPERSAREHRPRIAPLRTRGRDFPRQARPPPRCPQLCDNKCALPQSPGRASATRNPPQIAALSRRRLDRPTRLASTTVSRGPPGPAPSRSKRRRSRYLPLKRRSRTGNAVALEAAVPQSFS